MSVTFRTAEAADAPALAARGRRCFVETFGAHFPADDLALHLERKFGPGALAGEFLAPDLRIRMAEEDAEVAAYIKLALMDLPVPHEPGALEVKQLYVLEPWQGAGVAAALMRWAIDTARADGVPALYLSVWEKGARAQAFYRRHGFEIVGTAPFLLGSRAYQDPVMRLTL